MLASINIPSGEESSLTYGSWNTAEGHGCNESCKYFKTISYITCEYLLADTSSLQSYMSQVALSAKYPWFEKMHKMMNKHVLAGPAVLLTTPSLDVTGNEDSDHVLPSSDPMEESSNEDLGHTVHACNLPPIHDLVDAAPRNAGDYPNFDISTPPPHPIP